MIYPENKIEIIIVDDASTDGTRSIINDFVKSKPEFKTLRLDENQSGKLKGKVKAMAAGIKISSGEIILTTDADCIVNPLWAKTIASYYVGNVGVVNGFTSQTVERFIQRDAGD